jgi:hypothetical protein
MRHPKAYTALVFTMLGGLVALAVFIFVNAWLKYGAHWAILGTVVVVVVVGITEWAQAEDRRAG